MPPQPLFSVPQTHTPQRACWCPWDTALPPGGIWSAQLNLPSWPHNSPWREEVWWPLMGSTGVVWTHLPQGSSGPSSILSRLHSDLLGDSPASAWRGICWGSLPLCYSHQGPETGKLSGAKTRKQIRPQGASQCPNLSPSPAVHLSSAGEEEVFLYPSWCFRLV